MKLKAIGAFVAIRATSLLILYLAASYRDVDFFRIFRRWDSQWYRRIAEDGYGRVVIAADGRELSDYAFFPLFPLLERWIHHATSISILHSGVLISVLSSLLAALGIYYCIDRISGARAAFYTVVLWAALPVSGVLSLAYSESLFTALAAWALYFTLRKRWVLAGLLASLAGLTRPIGIAVALAVMATAFIYLRKGKRDRSAFIALFLAPLGWLGYLYWVGQEVGKWDGYLRVTSGWGNSIDGGSAFLQWWINLFTDVSPIAALAIALLIFALFYLLWIGWRKGVPLPLIIYSAVILLMALITSGYFSSKPRYLLPAFPLLYPIAIALSKKRGRELKSIIALILTFSAIYGTLWLTGNGPL
jgi:hypothetical protein